MNGVKDKFLNGIYQFLGSPEHNAYYDAMDILRICVQNMTDEELLKAMGQIKKEMPKNE